MDVSDLLAITLKKIENKGSQMGHTKKNIKKKKIKLKQKDFHSANSITLKEQLYLTNG
jgi:putative cell wall-binding protein